MGIFGKAIDGETKKSAQNDLIELVLHDTAEKMRIGRQAVAKGYGMTHQDRPWKSITQTAGGGSLGSAVLVALLCLGAAGAGAVGAWYLARHVFAPGHDASIKPAEYDIDLRVEGGKIVTDGPPRRVGE